METGAITQYVDVAQLVLYLFWIFFFGLVAYLTLEGKREGFPMEPDGYGKRQKNLSTGLLPMPTPKVFRTEFNGSFLSPHGKDDYHAPIAGKPINAFPGSPVEPTGKEPMLDNIGPGSYANRIDRPDLTVEGNFKIVPMRVDESFSVTASDIDPRGLEVKGFDGMAGATCTDIWVDRSEHIIRYLELKTNLGKAVLLPINLCVVKKDFLIVESILSNQFDKVPTTKNPNTVSLLEEEKIMAFYGAGTLMAYPRRRESIV
jgi:photosynthetic reaction center H subunit